MYYPGHSLGLVIHKVTEFCSKWKEQWIKKGWRTAGHMRVGHTDRLSEHKDTLSYASRVKSLTPFLYIKQ